MTLASSLTQLLLATIGGGGLLALVNALVTRRKVRAEAEAIASDTALRVLEGVGKELAAVRERLTKAEARASAAEDRAAAAEARTQEAESDLRFRLVFVRQQTQRIAEAYLGRIEELTVLIRHNGIDVSAWTPPKIDFSALDREYRPQ